MQRQNFPGRERSFHLADGTASGNFIRPAIIDGHIYSVKIETWHRSVGTAGL
jgi:hypothetical protein